MLSLFARPRRGARRARLCPRYARLALLIWVTTLTTSQTIASTDHDARIKESALRQIEALLLEKMQRTPAQRKLDSSLIYAIKAHRGDTLLTELPEFQLSAPVRADGTVLVDITASIDPSLVNLIQALDGEVINQFAQYDSIRAELPLMQLETLAEHESIRGVRVAAQLYTHALHRAGKSNSGNAFLGRTITEGDVAHTADAARAEFSVTGAGITSCALSDSVEELQDLQNSGDLPLDVTVLPGQDGAPGTSEGTALLEIIYDLAPDAQLFFATAANGTASFAQNILDLAGAGCDVIIDDAFYITEPVFQPGNVSQAIASVVAQGVVYVTASGNFFNLDSGFSGVWEGNYSGTSLPAVIAGAGYISAHDFGGTNVVTLINDGASSRFPITLQWANAAGQASDDYDLFMLTPGMTSVIEASTGVQDGNDDALEALLFSGDRTNVRLVVAKFAGNDVYFHLNTNGSLLDIGTDRQIFGHNGVAEAITVGAVDVATAMGAPFTGGAANPPEIFTSDGFRRVFFDANGNPVSDRGSGGVNVPKPDLVAADGVSTSSTNFLTFFGASASAPHVAAIAALYLEQNPAATVEEVRQALADSALDVGTPGFDRTTGAGIPMALATLDEDTLFEDSFEGSTR